MIFDQRYEGEGGRRKNAYLQRDLRPDSLFRKYLKQQGMGDSFFERQYYLDIGEEDFYIHLLFYHLRLRCFVVIELEKGGIKPEYAGKMNFYCNVADDRLKQEGDNPTIGLILCQDKKSVLVEYTLRGVAKLIGFSEYELTGALRDSLKSALPGVDEVELELSEEGEDGSEKRNRNGPERGVHNE